MPLRSTRCQCARGERTFDLDQVPRRAAAALPNHSTHYDWRVLAAALIFLICLLGYAAVDILASRAAGESGSLPTGALFVGILCVTLAHFLGWWAAVGAFALLAIVRVREALAARHSARTQRTSSSDESRP